MTHIEVDTYYAREFPQHKNYPALTADIETDVCVIGGGLAGINTALGLRERGKSVAVIEAKYVGFGGSGRNAGFVAKGYAAGEQTLSGKLGLKEAQALVAMTKNARKLIRERIQKYNIHAEPVKDGVLTISWRDDAEGYRACVERANDDFGLGFEFWPREKVREHCKSEKYFDGCFSPQDFQFMPYRYLHGLADAVTALGGKIFEQTPALSIDKQNGKWVVTTPHGKITAEHVVLCCGIYIGNLDKRLKNALFNVRTFITVTKPVDPAQLANSINTPYAIYDSRFSSDYYRILPGNRVLWGGRVSMWAEPDNIAKLHMQDMFNIYPQLKGHVEPDVAWGGDLAYAPHKMPQIGQIEPGYWYNTGFGGHGIAPTTVGGEVIAAAIASGDQSFKHFTPFGLGYTGGRLGPYVAQMVYWIWRARDYLNI